MNYIIYCYNNYYKKNLIEIKKLFIDSIIKKGK
jgi:hypothetical protein